MAIYSILWTILTKCLNRLYHYRNSMEIFSNEPRQYNEDIKTIRMINDSTFHACLTKVHNKILAKWLGNGFHPTSGQISLTSGLAKLGPSNDVYILFLYTHHAAFWNIRSFHGKCNAVESNEKEHCVIEPLLFNEVATFPSKQAFRR